MDFAMQMQTDLLRATIYFNEQMEKVYIPHNCRIYPFIKRAYDPAGGKCYYLSTWALMGLTTKDLLVRGQLDLPERPGWGAQNNYKHGWVQFSYEGQNYIYDSLEEHIWPQTYWEETFNPHCITFEKSLREILEELIFGVKLSDNLYKIGDYTYQFKRAKDMKLSYDSKDDGFLKDTLSGAQIHYFGSGQTSYFLAEDRSQ